ncbi:hypothetical protein Bbelb_314270 [Branchiostoma belcheri]|nr:hypothetical protein Bbelb_314270 [Branchiostoma belcheri]
MADDQIKNMFPSCGLFPPSQHGCWNPEPVKKTGEEGCSTEGVFGVDERFVFNKALVTLAGGRGSGREVSASGRLSDVYAYFDLSTAVGHSEPKEGLFRVMVCYHGNGENYRGSRNKTASGADCMEWSTDYNTNEYSWANLDNNYCRNPAGLNRPFCLTQDGSQEECDVIPCNENVCWDRGPPNYGKRSPKKRFYYVGERVTYTCNEGYTIGAGYTSEVRCTEDGNWLYDKPICSIDHRRRLIEEVLEIYGAGLAPENTTITFNGSVEQVIDLDEKNEQLVTSVVIDFKWWDNQLKWDPKYYGGIKTHNVLGSRIWTPSFTVKRNANRTVANSALQRVPRQPRKEDLDLAPTLEEVIKATDQQKSGKAAGVDGLPGSTEAQHCTPNSTNSLCAAGNRERFPRTSDTLLSSPFTRTKEKKSQCGFRANRGTTDMLHEDQRGQVRSNNDLSEHFPITNGVKQGYVLSPTLFTIFFSMMLQQATEYLGDEDDIYIKYPTDGSPFNLRRLQAHTKTLEQLIRELLFADDAALVAHTEFAMQRVTSCFVEASELFGLEVSLKKTEVLHQPVPLKKYRPTCIKIGEKPLKAIDKEVDNRLAKANNAFGRLHSRVWKSKHLKKDTKIIVYKAVVLTTLLYGSESWVTYRHHLRLLERFHQRCLRSILNIHWSDYVTNVEVLERAGILSIEAMLLKIQLRWAGHVSRMEGHGLPMIVLYGELSTGQRNRGAPKKRFKDCPRRSISRKSLSSCNIDHSQWSALATDRAVWRHTVHESVSAFERRRRTALKEKRSKRKNRTVTAPTPDPADVTYRGLQQDVPVRVSSDGLVVWSVETLTTTVCDADPFFFPADTMECHICFSAHTAIKQTIRKAFSFAKKDGSDECDTFSAVKTEGEWYRKDKMFAKDNREACFVLHLARAPLFHIATTVGPCIILVVLMVITFIMPLDRGDRISYGVTILLSMVVSLVFVTDVLPVKGVLPFFATVIIICMGLMGLFLFFTLVIIVIHDREGNLSPAAKIIFLRYMSKTLLLGDLTANKQANDEEPGVINNAAIEVTKYAHEAFNVQAGGEDAICFGDGNERNEQPSTPTEGVSGSSGLSELIAVVREVGDQTNAEIRELTKAVKNAEDVSDYILLAKVLDRLCLVMYVITIAATVPMTMYLAK